MQNTFHEFQYLITQEYIKPNTINLADYKPDYSTVRYAVINGNRAVVLTTEHPFITSSYISDMYALNDNISAAAINNAHAMGYIKLQPNDLFVTLYNYFTPLTSAI